MEYMDDRYQEETGTTESYPDINKRIQFYRDKGRMPKPGELEGDNSVIEAATKVSLPRFPECQKGESISDKEIKRRLSQIKATGYFVTPYSKMSRDDAWRCLSDLRKEIKGKARDAGLENLVLEIERENSKKSRDAMHFR